MVHSWASRKSGYAERILRELARAVRDSESEEWRTIHGARVRIKNGVVVGGAGGELNGLRVDPSAPGATMPSASGRNRLQVRGFRSKQKANNHFSKHKKEFSLLGITTADKYVQYAIKLIESPVGKNVLGHVDKNRYVTRYSKTDNVYVKESALKGIFTMYIPQEGALYYNNERRKDEERKEE